MYYRLDSQYILSHFTTHVLNLQLTHHTQGFQVAPLSSALSHALLSLARSCAGVISQSQVLLSFGVVAELFNGVRDVSHRPEPYHGAPVPSTLPKRGPHAPQHNQRRELHMQVRSGIYRISCTQGHPRSA